ncbi:NAD(P)/FAD-dependent oxidoreductase [Plantactinospora siamensis]|uniref:NAD(P)/FAD-dependent oxidoreductase n=1 Tax=Plantactinospora siamensis TaxID=555372 RepID=A0ABV6P5L0_9ACTN
MLQPAHILVVGGGYVGMFAARRLSRKLSPRAARITVVNPQPTMTYQPFLPEAAAGSIEARHVVVPLRRMLPGCRVIVGEVSFADHQRRVATIAPPQGPAFELPYDILVLAPGSITRTLPVPGLAEHGIGFKNIGEAIYLRNHVLSRLDAAAATDDPARRRRALTFVFVGGGYSGVEGCAELADMTRSALRYYPELSADELRWLLVEATNRIMPEVGVGLSAYVAQRMVRRGIEVRLGTRVTSMVGGHVVLSDGEEFPAETVVWTAGVRANPLAARSGLPVDRTGRLRCDAELRVWGVPAAWGAGDSAAVPDLSVPGDATCAPTAQHAVRQARRLADNLVRELRGRPLRPYRHANAGSVASLGLHQGAAEIYGIRMRGLVAWLVHRAYHLMMVPTVNRKARVAADWALALLFRREIVPLAQVQAPRRDWAVAAHTPAPAGAGVLPEPLVSRRAARQPAGPPRREPPAS